MTTGAKASAFAGIQGGRAAIGAVAATRGITVDATESDRKEFVSNTDILVPVASPLYLPPSVVMQSRQFPNTGGN